MMHCSRNETFSVWRHFRVVEAHQGEQALAQHLLLLLRRRGGQHGRGEAGALLARAPPRLAPSAAVRAPAPRPPLGHGRLRVMHGDRRE